MSIVSFSKSFSDTLPMESASFDPKGCSSPVFFVDVGFLCVGLPHMAPGIVFLWNCCNKSKLATLELHEQPLFNRCKSFEGFGQLN